jgi:FtsP/CotA-like multicopper oxidase with cupredoxin domain
MKRRDFLKIGMAGMAAIVVGNIKIPYMYANKVFAANNVINLSMEEALVEMCDKNAFYHWVYSSNDPDSLSGKKGMQGVGLSYPGPTIFATAGDVVTLKITNNLPAATPHSFQILGTRIRTGPIPSGETRSIAFTVPDAGTYMYLDPLNAPINRALGLHGVLVSLPAAPQLGHKFTPFSKPTSSVQQIFDDYADPNFTDLPMNELDKPEGAAWFPEPEKNRFRIWVFGSTDNVLHTEIMNGQMPTPAEFRARYKPRYQMINGRSGGYAVVDKGIHPASRIGQPILLRIINGGMVQWSAHWHGNHIWILSVNNQVQDNVFSVDTWSIRPLDRIDCLLPYRMPPDIPNPSGNPKHVPPNGLLRNIVPVELQLRPGGNDFPLQRPMGFPMHCHSEMSQTAAGGNYPGGVVTHWQIIGDIDGVDYLDFFGPDLPGIGSEIP